MYLAGQTCFRIFCTFNSFTNTGCKGVVFFFRVHRTAHTAGFLESSFEKLTKIPFQYHPLHHPHYHPANSLGPGSTELSVYRLLEVAEGITYRLKCISWSWPEAHFSFIIPWHNQDRKVWVIKRTQFLCGDLYTYEVCPEVSSHVIWKIEAFIEEGTRYRKRCT